VVSCTHSQCGSIARHCLGDGGRGGSGASGQVLDVDQMQGAPRGAMAAAALLPRSAMTAAAKSGQG
jgi:uncharacterized protein YceK